MSESDDPFAKLMAEHGFTPDQNIEAATRQELAEHSIRQLNISAANLYQLKEASWRDFNDEAAETDYLSARMEHFDSLTLRIRGVYDFFVGLSSKHLEEVLKKTMQIEAVNRETAVSSAEEAGFMVLGQQRVLLLSDQAPDLTSFARGMLAAQEVLIRQTAAKQPGADPKTLPSTTFSRLVAKEVKDLADDFTLAI